MMVDSTTYSFADVNHLANSYAASLQALGVGRGDTVAIFMENSAEFVITSFAVNRLGAVWVPINVYLKGEFLLDPLKRSGAGILVADSHLLPRLAEFSDDIKMKHVVVRTTEEAVTTIVPSGSERIDIRQLAEAGGEPVVPDLGPSDTSSVMWTSGTTGPPKGVMQSHNAWIAGADCMNRGRDVREGDVFYCCVPMYNSGGWVLNVYAALVAGLPIGIDASFSVTEFWNRCRFYGATQILTMGTMHIYLWQAPEQPSDQDNPVRVGGCIPMPPDLLEPFKERFGIEYVWSGFGQSECMPWSITDRSRQWKPGSCGTARSDLEVRVNDENDRELAAGQVGEICIRPREPWTIFSGYFKDPEATLRSFRNLWYHSGDLGRIDEDHEMFFVDRKADFMRYKGRNVSSFEVERVVRQHPAVADVAAHGIPAEELPQESEVKVCVVLQPGEEISPEELATFVNDRAPYYVVPRYIEFVETLPYTPTGRVQKFRLRERGVTAATWDAKRAGFRPTR
jgi:carnitine-CoA ligase